MKMRWKSSIEWRTFYSIQTGERTRVKSIPIALKACAWGSLKDCVIIILLSPWSHQGSNNKISFLSNLPAGSSCGAKAQKYHRSFEGRKTA